MRTVLGDSGGEEQPECRGPPGARAGAGGVPASGARRGRVLGEGIQVSCQLEKKKKNTDIVQWVHLVLGTLCMLEAEGHTVDGSPKSPINI